MAVKPTPTQEENDRAAMGEHVIEKEHDGSPIEGAPPPETGEGEPPPEGSIDYPRRKQMETKKPAQQAGYENRALHTPAQPPARDSD